MYGLSRGLQDGGLSMLTPEPQGLLLNTLFPSTKGNDGVEG